MAPSEVTPGGRAKNVYFTRDSLAVDLLDGRTIMVPLVWYPTLLEASPEQRKNWKISGGGIHWPDIGETLSTEGLLYGTPREAGQVVTARWVYLCGLGLWIAVWLSIFLCTFEGNGPQRLAVILHKLYAGKGWILAFPFTIGLLALVANLWLWWSPMGFATYETEVEVIEFVERNSSWFLVASGTLLTAAALFLTRSTEGGLPPPPLAREGLLVVVMFELASLLCLFLVVSLYWVPPDPKKLALLRHLKTVPYSYGVSFFAAAITALVVAVMSYYA